MADLLELSEQLWEGSRTVEEAHPLFVSAHGEVADGVYSVCNFAGVHAVATDDGLVLVDTGPPFTAKANHEVLRTWRHDALRLAVYTHGHIDHVFGLGPFEAEARDRGEPSARVVAHRLVPARFDRYRETVGWNSAINRRQFGLGEEFHWPSEWPYPNETYLDALDVDVGGTRFELRHGRGETDDATWVFVPAHRLLCTGDFFIWATPNAGNPQKVQRYPAEWARALRQMAARDAEILLPGHGWPIIGAARVRQALHDTADLLDSLYRQTVQLMNEGARLDDIVHGVHAPEHLLERPYLQPVYDEPEFVVHNVWRKLGGWWDGNPARLQPPREQTLASELAALSGGVASVAARAEALAEAGELALAASLAELATQAAPDDEGVHRVRAEVFRRREAAASSTMAKGVYGAAAAESEAHGA